MRRQYVSCARQASSEAIERGRILASVRGGRLVQRNSMSTEQDRFVMLVVAYV